MPFDLPPIGQQYQSLPAIRCMSRSISQMPVLIAKTANKIVPSVGKEDVDSFVPQSVSELSRTTFKYLPFERMKLSTIGWVTNRPWRCGGEHSYLLEIHPKSDKETWLAISSDGVAGRSDAGLGMVLKNASHELTQEERRSFDPPLGADIRAYTQRLDGKVVLICESKFQGKNRYELSFNHNPDKSSFFVPAQISFEAEPAQYKRYIRKVKAALKTIEWLDQDDIKIEYR